MQDTDISTCPLPSSQVTCPGPPPARTSAACSPSTALSRTPSSPPVSDQGRRGEGRASSSLMRLKPPRRRHSDMPPSRTLPLCNSNEAAHTPVCGGMFRAAAVSVCECPVVGGVCVSKTSLRNSIIMQHACKMPSPFAHLSAHCSHSTAVTHHHRLVVHAPQWFSAHTGACPLLLTRACPFSQVL